MSKRDKHITIDGGRPIKIVDRVIETVIEQFTDVLAERDEPELDERDLKVLCYKAIGVYMNLSEAATSESQIGARFIEKFKEDLKDIGLNFPEVSFASVRLDKPCPADAPPEVKAAYAEAKLKEDTR